MARIRSVHPALFTDEAFMALSYPAKILIIGIWTEADDGGAFSWKPKTLKVRILPDDPSDPAALLDELTAANMIRPYQVDGNQYGAVRNFCRYQKPKKPTYPLPRVDWVDTYTARVGDEFPTASPPLPQQSPDGSHRKEGGKEGEGGSKILPPAIAGPPSQAAPVSEPKAEGPPEPVPKAKAATRRERGTRLPNDWQPSEAGITYARDHGLTNGNLAGVVERFTDHWRQSTLDSAWKADWDAAWRTWVRNEAERHRPAGPAPYPGNGRAAGGRDTRPSPLTAAVGNILSRRGLD